MSLLWQSFTSEVGWKGSTSSSDVVLLNIVKLKCSSSADLNAMARYESMLIIILSDFKKVCLKAVAESPGSLENLTSSSTIVTFSAMFVSIVAIAT